MTDDISPTQLRGRQFRRRKYVEGQKQVNIWLCPDAYNALVDAVFERKMAGQINETYSTWINHLILDSARK